MRRLETLVDEIEAQLQQSSEREVSSSQIGQLVLKYLSHENEVAYIRFASVYGQFQGIKDFAETLNQLQTSTDVKRSHRDSSYSTEERADREESTATIAP